MIIAYKGFDLGGKAVKGTIEAPSAADAYDLLRKQSVLATHVVGTDRPGATGTIAASDRPSRYRSAKAGDLSHFFRQLSILVSTKTPLAESLQVLEQQAKDTGMHPIIADLRRRVEEGESLAEAMRIHSTVFDAVSCSMVAAGEAGGSLDQMLATLTTLVRQQHVMRRAISGAMVYPIILLSIGSVVMVVMVTFVLPQFRELFETLHAPLPWSTAALMAAGTVIRTGWFVLIPAVGFAIWVAVRWVRSAGGQAAVGRVIMATPKLGPMSCSISTARIVRLLGSMLAAKINLLAALKLARESTASEPYIKLLEDAEAAVSRGQSLASVFTSCSFVPGAVSAAIASGERSGQLAPVLTQIADYLDEDNQQVMKTISTIIEPVILTLLGIIIGGVAMSMFLPLFDLAGAGGGGPG
jgi:type IV pilus assembly protein PilC